MCTDYEKLFAEEHSKMNNSTFPICIIGEGAGWGAFINDDYIDWGMRWE